MNTDEMIKITQNAINNANNLQSKLTNEILMISGMSSPKVRHFLNNLITPQSRYLEIGCWRGSTFISALYQNNPECAFAIDNWSEFDESNFQIFCYDYAYGKTRNIFRYNVREFLSCPITIIEEDAFTIDKSRIKDINTYFYDGAHDYESQKKALIYYYDSLSDSFVFIIDDWNEEAAQEGTKDSIKELGLKVYFEYEGYAELNGDIRNWWNGLYISVLGKK